MLSATNISHTFTTTSGEEVEALRDISLTIPGGQVVSIVGPSGCGKSTLLRIFGGFFPPTSGEVAGGPDDEEQKPITGPGTDRGMIFQAPNLFPWLDVRRNVRLASTFTGDGEAAREADTLLELVGLEKAKNRYPYELSGGMQQRAQIARVLAASPPNVLMDEPFGALDPFTRENLQAELLRVWSRYKPTIVFITHSVEEAIIVGDRVVVMAPHPGRIIGDIAVPDKLGAVTNLAPAIADMGRAGAEDIPSRSALRAEIRRLVSEPELVELRRELTTHIAEAHAA